MRVLGRTTFTAAMLAAATMLSPVAQAQQTTPAAPAPAAPAPAAPAPAPAPAAPSGLTARPITQPTHHRMTLNQRFDAANTTHDGHLTLAQAKSGNMQSVVRNFDQIDTDKKGYVTIADIHAYNRAKYHARVHKPAPATDSKTQ